jgi:hypothetical protein
MAYLEHAHKQFLEARRTLDAVHQKHATASATAAGG